MRKPGHALTVRRYRFNHSAFCEICVLRSQTADNHVFESKYKVNLKYFALLSENKKVYLKKMRILYYTVNFYFFNAMLYNLGTMSRH